MDPTKKEIRQYRRDRARVDVLRAELAKLEPAVDALEDKLLEWIEDQSSGDIATVHGMTLVIVPTPAKVNWYQAFVDRCGEDAALSLINTVESQNAARIVVTDGPKAEG